MKKLALVLVALTLLIASPVMGETIRLICKYSHTIDAQGKSSKTSEEDLITIKYSDNGQASIKKQDLEAEYTGKISVEEIHGKTSYKIGQSVFNETLTINRYTGAIERTFGFVGKSDGLVHFGKCIPVKEKLF